jgi:hypothetical protein
MAFVVAFLALSVVADKSAMFVGLSLPKRGTGLLSGLCEKGQHLLGNVPRSLDGRTTFPPLAECPAKVARLMFMASRNPIRSRT